MKRFAVVLLFTLAWTPVFGQNTVIKLQQLDMYTWTGGAFLPGLTNVFATISRTPPGNGNYAVTLRPEGSGMVVYVKLENYLPPDPPGALNLQVGVVTIKQPSEPPNPPQVIMQVPVVLNNPYYAKATGYGNETLGVACWAQLPTETACVLGQVSETPLRKFVGWSGLAVDLGCVQDRIIVVDSWLQYHQCVVDVQSYFQQADRQCYIKAVSVPTTPTPAGTDVTVSLSGGTTLGFSEVTEPGFTALVPSASGPSLPTGFRLGSPPRYYDITTTAVYSGSINVCISYSGMIFGAGALRLLHYEDGRWVDCTTNVDTVSQVICGVVNSLSPFVVAERTTIPVDIDIKPGSYPNSFNSNSQGVLPVAILGSAEFDVTQIDPWSLGLGTMTVRVKKNGQPQCSMEDVNGDGYNDLVCRFADDGTLVGSGTTTITLTGNLKPEFRETPIEGSDEIRIVP